MSSLLIRNGRIIDPARNFDGMGDILITDGRIAPAGEGAVPADCAVVDASGMIVCPGFIDLHCHLRQPGFEAKETIASGTLAAARGGFTTVCCMPNTNPPLDSVETLDYVKSVAAKEGVVRVLPIACVSKGRKGEEMAELAALAGAGAIGFSDDGGPVASSGLMRQAMEAARQLGLPVIDHCEDTSLSAGGQINEGAVAAKLGLRGIPAAAEEIIVARDIALAQLTGAHLHIAHVSTEGSVELIRRAKEKGINVTAEVTPHHLTLTEEALLSRDTGAKVSPPLRTKRDVEVLIHALKDGVIDIIATDHAPHAYADKNGDFSKAAVGISGLETALGSLMALVQGEWLTLPELVARLTSKPANIIGEKFGQLGTLAPGAYADVTIFDPNREWVVAPAAFASRGKNTPLAGKTLTGKVIATIYQGKLVCKDDSLKFGKEKVLRQL